MAADRERRWRQAHAGMKLATAAALSSLLAIVLAAAFGRSGAARAEPSSARGGPAPEIVAPTIEGVTFRLSNLRGKVVVLDFLTAGCGSCEVEAPLLERAAGQYSGRGVSVAIIDLSNTAPGRLRAYYRRDLSLARVTVVRDHRLRIARA